MEPDRLGVTLFGDQSDGKVHLRADIAEDLGVLVWVQFECAFVVSRGPKYS